MNKKYLMKVNDIYGLSRRIKDVNPNYTLFLNLKTKKYEIHDLSNNVCSLCLTFFPHELNGAIIRKLHQSKRENMKKYFIEIEENNIKLEEQKQSKLLDNANDVTKDILTYASHANREVDCSEIKNIVSRLEEK